MGVEFSGDIKWEPSFSPLDLPDLIIWMDPLAEFITLNGTDVSSWIARNDATIDAAQGTGSKQPLYDLADQNGLNTINFNAVNNDQLITGTLTHNLNAADWYLAIALIDPELSSTKSIVSVGAGSDVLQMLVSSATPTVWRGSGLAFSSLTMPLSTWSVLEFWRSGSSFRCRLNFLEDTDSHTSTNDPGSSSTISIGQTQGGSGETWKGKLGDIVFTSSLPNQHQRNQVYNYLKDKWNL